MINSKLTPKIIGFDERTAFALNVTRKNCAKYVQGVVQQETTALTATALDNDPLWSHVYSRTPT